MNARGQFDVCIPIVNQICTDDHSEVLAVMGLEMLSLGQRDKAEKLARAADSGTAAQAPSLIALWLAIGSPDSPEKAKEALAHAQAIAPEPAEKQSFTPVQRIGWAGGWARQAGKLDKARKLLLADKGGSADERFRAKAAAAEAVIVTQPSDSTELQACADQLAVDFKKEPAPMWVLWRLVHLSLKAGRADLAKFFTDKIGDPTLKAQAQLVLLRADLKGKKETADWNRAKEVGDPESMAQSLAVVEIARHNTRIGGDSKVRKDLRDWTTERERWKPFVYVGIALAGYPEEN